MPPNAQPAQVVRNQGSVILQKTIREMTRTHTNKSGDISCCFVDRVKIQMTIAKTWGTSDAERGLSYPCDLLISHPDDSLYRGISIDASRETIFRWLCQLRVAPYSYDWIDNAGCESPRQLTPGLEHLAVGQDVMEIFKLANFARDQHLTLRIKANSKAQRVFGDLAVSYLIVTKGGNSCRLLVKLVVQHPPGVWGRLMGTLLAWGDLIMMRRQLMNLKQLAEG